MIKTCWGNSLTLMKSLVKFLPSDIENKMNIDPLSASFEIHLAYLLSQQKNLMLKTRENTGCDKGVDFILEFKEPDYLQKILIEATVPTEGKSGKNQVPEFKEKGIMQEVESDKMQLRMLSAMRDKLEQYNRWIKFGSYNSSDYYIVAISLSKLSGRCVDLDEDSFILGAFYPIGNPQVLFNKTNGVDRGACCYEEHEYKPTIQKYSGNLAHETLDICKSIFFEKKDYSAVSAALISRRGCIDCSTFSNARKVRNDLILIHNFEANNKLPQKIIDVEVEYVCKKGTDSYHLVKV